MSEPDTDQSALPLSGLRVLDLSSLYAAPLISTTLGDFGADVIKVERPRGDDARHWGVSKGDVPLWWKVIARNKRLLTLDLNLEADREKVRELCEWADVVIENFRPGRMEMWGLSYEALSAVNPRLIMVRVTGFGQYGPYSSQPGFGTLAEAYSGFAYITGLPDGPPTLPPFGLADGIAGITGTYATLIALYWRDARSGGRGQYIDVSLYEPLFSILGPQTVEYTQLGLVQERNGNRSTRTAPRNTYRTSDGHWVAISGGTQEIANRVMAAVGQPELTHDDRFSSAEERVKNSDAIDAIVRDWIAAHDLSEVLDSFAKCEAPIAPVYSIAQILADPHYQARESYVAVEDADLGSVIMQNVVPKLSLTPGRIRHTGRTEIGADTAAVLKEIENRRRNVWRQA